MERVASLCTVQGKPQQARELLAPVYDRFTEGFDMRDIKKAKALLDEVASCRVQSVRLPLMAHRQRSVTVRFGLLS